MWQFSHCGDREIRLQGKWRPYTTNVTASAHIFGKCKMSHKKCSDMCCNLQLRFSFDWSTSSITLLWGLVIGENFSMCYMLIIDIVSREMCYESHTIGGHWRIFLILPISVAAARLTASWLQKPWLITHMTKLVTVFPIWTVTRLESPAQVSPEPYLLNF